jgi:WD40 repeat protein
MRVLGRILLFCVFSTVFLSGCGGNASNAFSDNTYALCDKPATNESGSIDTTAKFVVIHLGDRAIDENLTSKLPAQRQASKDSDLGGVLCLTQIKAPIVGESYVGQTTGQVYQNQCVRNIYLADVYVVNVKTRQTVYLAHLRGSEPADCPVYLYSGDKPVLDGGPIADVTIVDTINSAPGSSSASVDNAAAPAGNLPFKVLVGAKDKLTSVAISPDMQMVVTGGADHTVMLWSMKYFNLMNTWNGHADQVVAMAYSPTGTQFASASRDKTIILWAPSTGDKLFTLTGHSAYVSSVAFSPDGKLLASGSGDKTIRLWDTTTGKLMLTLNGSSDAVLTLAFSPDGSQIASAGLDKIVRLWDVKSGKQVSQLTGHTGYIDSVAYNAAGTLLASGGADKTIKLWDVKSGAVHATLSGHTDTVLSIAFSPDGKLLASGSADKSIRLWAPADGKSLSTLNAHTDYVSGIAFSKDSSLMISVSADKSVRVWNPSAFK